jgi:hypothetical protein
LENGFVFGNSLNVNGKKNEQGKTVVAGLQQYGCTIGHFEPASPTSKTELEKSFDLVQRQMEKHPGYGGRLQMRDASEDFKREQRLIRSEKMEPTERRYTFLEFLEVVGEMVRKYNATPNFGEHLKGLSPDEAFIMLADRNNPPTVFAPEIAWYLANERYRVEVKVNGVNFQHYGRTIRVRGGELAKFIGVELWALVDRRDPSLVTFMNLDFSSPFTMEVSQSPSAAESLVASGSGAHFLFNQSRRMYSRPEMVDWIDTAVCNRNVPVAPVTTPQFSVCMTRAADQVEWNYKQFRRRVRRWEKLPAHNTEADIKLVARSVFKGASAAVVAQVTAYAMVSKRDLSAVGDVANEVRYMLGTDDLNQATSLQVHEAIYGHLFPSDKTFSEGMEEARKKERKGRGGRAASASAAITVAAAADISAAEPLPDSSTGTRPAGIPIASARDRGEAVLQKI